MDKKRLLELAGVLVEGQDPAQKFFADLAASPRNAETKTYDPEKVEQLLDAAANAMSWIGYEQHPADKEAKERLEQAYHALTGHSTWERK